MAKQHKQAKSLNCRIDIGIFNRLEEFTAETKLSKTATVEKALRLYLDRYKRSGKI